jgi:flagellar basal body-associated protein FliL
VALAPEQTLDERYGRGRPGRGKIVAVVVAVLVLAAAVGWFAYASIAGAASATGTDVGFHVVDDGTIQVTFDVTKPKKSSATCTVQALDPSFATVGTLQVTIGPAGTGTVRRTVTLRTTNRATAGEVTTCAVVH